MNEFSILEQHIGLSKVIEDSFANDEEFSIEQFVDSFIEENSGDDKSISYLAFNLILQSTFNFDMDLLRSNLIQYCRKIIDLYISSGTVTIDEENDDWYEEVASKTYNDGVWTNYKNYLLNHKNFTEEDIYTVDSSTRKIMSSIANPNNSTPSKDRGLVIGDIQSGKTANYLGLIARAADAEINRIVVLTGVTESLRRQTQLRIEYDIIGTTKKNDYSEYENVGIREFNEKYSSNIEMITKPDEDFNSNQIDRSSAKTKIYVVKKNVSILDSLIRYVQNFEENETLMIIDDEADNATINTNYNAIASEVSKINGQIRKLLNSINKSYYVSYTGTPYANLLIAKDVNDNSYKEDLFPESFIVRLARSKHYTGYKKYFQSSLTDKIIEPIARENGDKLEQAMIDYFVRSSMKLMLFENGLDKTKHSAFMIHTSSRISEHVETRNEIENLYNSIATKLIKKYDTTFNNKVNRSILLVKQAFAIQNREEEFPYSTSAILDKIKNMLHEHGQYEIKVINSDPTEDSRLEYDNGYKNYILIGGNALSRGLTIEGLLVTYYLRDAKTMDTISQMGRWYGYRGSYLYLTRLYISVDLIKYLYNINQVDEEIIVQIQNMNNEGKSPKYFQWNIPGFSDIYLTSNNKLGDANISFDNFSGKGPQLLTVNKTKFDEHIQYLQYFHYSKETEYRRNSLITKNVSSHDVIELLDNYLNVNNGEYTLTTNPNSWIDYIKESNKVGELINWTVAIAGISGKTVNKQINILNNEINIATRSIFTIHENNEDLIQLKIVDTPEDQSLDFEEKIERNKARKLRSPQNGLLIFYPINLGDVEDTRVMSVVISFPFSAKRIDKKQKTYIN